MFQAKKCLLAVFFHWNRRTKDGNNYCNFNLNSSLKQISSQWMFCFFSIKWNKVTNLAFQKPFFPFFPLIENNIHPCSCQTTDWRQEAAMLWWMYTWSAVKALVTGLSWNTGCRHLGTVADRPRFIPFECVCLLCSAFSVATDKLAALIVFIPPYPRGCCNSCKTLLYWHWETSCYWFLLSQTQHYRQVSVKYCR